MSGRGLATICREAGYPVIGLWRRHSAHHHRPRHAISISWHDRVSAAAFRVAEPSVERLRLLALVSTSSGDTIVLCMEVKMRTTLALDDELVAKAQAFTGLKEKSSLVREALKALIERESARRLARLGGSEPSLEAPPRRRPASA